MARLDGESRIFTRWKGLFYTFGEKVYLLTQEERGEHTLCEVPCKRQSLNRNSASDINEEITGLPVCIEGKFVGGGK